LTITILFLPRSSELRERLRYRSGDGARSLWDRTRASWNVRR